MPRASLNHIRHCKRSLRHSRHHCTTLAARPPPRCHVRAAVKARPRRLGGTVCRRRALCQFGTCDSGGAVATNKRRQMVVAATPRSRPSPSCWQKGGSETQPACRRIDPSAARANIQTGTRCRDRELRCHLLRMTGRKWPGPPTGKPAQFFSGIIASSRTRVFFCYVSETYLRSGDLHCSRVTRV